MGIFRPRNNAGVIFEISAILLFIAFLTAFGRFFFHDGISESSRIVVCDKDGEIHNLIGDGFYIREKEKELRVKLGDNYVGVFPNYRWWKEGVSKKEFRRNDKP